MVRPSVLYASVLSGAAFILALSAFAALAAAALAADAERGAQFARRACLVCHAVSARQVSPDPNAPPFGVVAGSRQFRAQGARLLWEKHPRMPNFALTGDEAADVAAYIKSLAK
jgi:mono/diheme cytochrome c family protein